MRTAFLVAAKCPIGTCKRTNTWCLGESLKSSFLLDQGHLSRMPTSSSPTQTTLEDPYVVPISPQYDSLRFNKRGSLIGDNSVYGHTLASSSINKEGLSGSWERGRNLSPYWWLSSHCKLLCMLSPNLYVRCFLSFISTKKLIFPNHGSQVLTIFFAHWKSFMLHLFIWLPQDSLDGYHPLFLSCREIFGHSIPAESLSHCIDLYQDLQYEAGWSLSISPS